MPLGIGQNVCVLREYGVFERSTTDGSDVLWLFPYEYRVVLKITKAIYEQSS